MIILKRILIFGSYSNNPPHWRSREYHRHYHHPSCLTPLDPSALSALLSRLPEPTVHVGDGAFEDDEKHREHFIHPQNASMARPPKSGLLLPISFPLPPDERTEQPFDLSSLPYIHGYQEEEQTAPPLAVTRFTPSAHLVEHSLSLVSLTFSQPMVPLSSISQVEADSAALPISPACGWEMEMAWNPRLCSLRPSTASHFQRHLHSLLLRVRISPPPILSHIYLSEEERGSTPRAKFSEGNFEIVDERTAKDEWPGIINNDIGGMWVSFRLKEKLLQLATSYVLCVPSSGCPSTEGNLTSKENWSTSFMTYGPLVIASSYSYGAQSKLWHLQFSNELDHSSVSKSAIHMFPSIEEFKVIHTDGSSLIVVQPVVKSAATYVVTVDTSIKDIHGQYLDESKATAEFQSDGVEALEGFIVGPPDMVVLNPSTLKDPCIPLSVLNFSSCGIQVVQVAVDDYSSYTDLHSFTHSSYTEGKTCSFGKKVHDQEVEHQVPTRAYREGMDAMPRQLRTLQGWTFCICMAWVTSLESGAPVCKATMRVGSQMEHTDDFGLAVVKSEGVNESEMICVQKEVSTSQQWSYAVHDARWNKLTEGEISLNEFGSFFFTFVNPDNANLGDASVSLEYKAERAQKSSYYHTVRVQKFRTPEFEVKTTHWAPSALYAHSSRSSFVIASTSANTRTRPIYVWQS
ncbi:hypothetical protein GOP47_0000716 [Adiantum capillus-veneris]|uniref:Uncharacterized protein n=1 Tax=Adiantum capillus-veneris TaxID=13818 RepID=A0A9D4ZT67_ADICA|nr:hypothetical protein GOP47_0000716 [Adiantum capillus-veneris]